MSKLKNFFNKISSNNKIYTAEDIGNMSNNEFVQNEKAINFQLKNLGIPRQNDLTGNPDVVFVHSYTKDDGTEVKAHYRSKPDEIKNTRYQSNSITGSAANISNLNTHNYSSKTQMKKADFSNLESVNYFAKINAEKNANRPDARELMNIALSGFKNLPEHPEFNIFEPDAVGFVNKTLNIGKLEKLAIPTNWHGVIYDKNSGFGKRLSNSPELQNQVIAKYNKNTKTFNTNQILIEFKQDKNLNYSIGHGTILNPKVKNDGTFTGILFDKYDYKFLTKKELLNDSTRALNNKAYGLQSVNIIKNFYVIIPINFKLKR